MSRTKEFKRIVYAAIIIEAHQPENKEFISNAKEGKDNEEQHHVEKKKQENLFDFTGRLRGCITTYGRCRIGYPPLPPPAWESFPEPWLSRPQKINWMKRLLNIAKASEYVGLSPNVIRDLIAKRRFPFRNVSRGSKPVFRFDIKELDRWIDGLPGLTIEELH